MYMYIYIYICIIRTKILHAYGFHPIRIPASGSPLKGVKSFKIQARQLPRNFDPEDLMFVKC